MNAQKVYLLVYRPKFGRLTYSLAHLLNAYWLSCQEIDEEKIFHSPMCPLNVIDWVRRGLAG